ncbi:MAG: lysophospholipid acyltransferase family protein [bacterium]
MSLSNLKQLFYYFPLRWLATLLPISLIGVLGTLCAYIEILTIRPGTKKRLFVNLMTALGLENDSQKCATLCFNVIRHYIWNILEFTQAHRLWKGRKTNFIQLVGFEHITQSLRQGRGVVLVGGHLATFEFHTTAVAWQGYSSALVEPRETQLDNIPSGIPRIIQIYRRRHQTRYLQYETIYTGMGFRQALKFLKQGGVVGIAIDYPVVTHSVICRFLGQERKVPLGPAYLAMKTDADIVIAHLERITFGKNRLTFIPVPVIKTEDFITDMSSLSIQLAQTYEQFILKHPEQWAWQMWLQNQ